MGIGYEICIMETFLGFDVFDSLEIFFDFGLFFWVFISSLFLHCCELKSFCYLRNRVR